MQQVSTKGRNELQQQIVWQLKPKDQELAFVIQDSKVYYSIFPSDIKVPSSALIKLLQGIFEEQQDLSFFLLRNRIYTSYELSEMDLGMLKVVAKRATANILPQDYGIILNHFTFINIGADHLLIFSTLRSLPSLMELQNLAEEFKAVPANQRARLEWLRFKADANASFPALHDSHRKIAAVLIDKEDNLIGFGLNQNSKNKTLHAEVNLVQNYYLHHQTLFPANSLILSTHKPCKMCAGMLFDSCLNPSSLKVTYEVEESGSHSRNTVLDRRG